MVRHGGLIERRMSDLASTINVFDNFQGAVHMHGLLFFVSSLAIAPCATVSELTADFFIT